MQRHEYNSPHYHPLHDDDHGPLFDGLAPQRAACPLPIEHDANATRDLLAIALPIVARHVGGNFIKTTDARRLHAFLGNGDMFAHWIKDRIERYNLVENESIFSYWENPQKPQGGRPAKEYALTLVAAIQIGAGENNIKGRQVLAYLSELLGQKLTAPAFNPRDPHQMLAYIADYARRNIALEEQVEGLESKIEHDAPKLESFDDLVSAKGGMLVRTAAKELNPVIGQDRLYEWMRQRDVHILIPGTREPYQDHRDAGRFFLKPRTYKTPDGETKLDHTLIVTPKGLAFLQEHWKKYHQAHAAQGGAA